MVRNLGYQKVCEFCKKDFRHFQRQTKTCSIECKKKRDYLITGRISKLKIPTGTTGAISELEVCADLMKKGYAVFRSQSPACFCDLVAIKGNKIFKIEARTGYRNIATDSLAFSTKVHGAPNLFGVYSVPDNKVFYFDINKEKVKI